MSTYDLKLTDHRCQLTTTTYYLLQFDLIWWEKKEEFWKKIWKKWWLKKEQAVCMIWLPKLLWWPKLTNLYKKNSADKLDSIIANLVHQSTNWQKKKYYTKIFALQQNWSKKMAFKNKNRKNLNCMIQHLIVSEFI